MESSQLEEGIIKYLHEGGEGGEASVRVELRTRFPGNGGPIITNEGVITAVRRNHNAIPGSGQNMYLRHVIIKKLEDYFYRLGVYHFAHIPRPLGHVTNGNEKIKEAYLYEWVFGSEGFPWIISEYGGGKSSVNLDEWNKFSDSFNVAGINLGEDITTPENQDVSKNIIHMFPNIYPHEGELSLAWKRIDFGPDSAPIRYDVLMRFLKDNENKLVEVLRSERYELMVLATKYLDFTTRSSFTDYEAGMLEIHLRDYRKASLQHQISRGGCNTSAHAYFGGTLNLGQSPFSQKAREDKK